MNKIYTIICMIGLLVSCQPQKTPPQSKIEVRIIAPESFETTHTITINELIEGDYDFASFIETLPTMPGKHEVRIKVEKNGITNEIKVPITLVEPVTVEPITIEYPETVTIEEGQTLDLSAIISGNYDSIQADIPELTAGQHQILVTLKKELISKEISILVIVTESIETFNGYFIQYPGSQVTEVREDGLMLVNKQYRLPSYYEPSDLEVVNNDYSFDGSENYLRAAANAALSELIEQAKAEGITIKVSNCYRSFDDQRSIYTHYLLNDDQETVDSYSARPGHSEHQLGTTCDLASASAQLSDFTGTAEQYWLAQNAHRFGFVLSYPKGLEQQTGYIYESWHYRYVGTAIASQIYEQNSLFEIYYHQYLK